MITELFAAADPLRETPSVYTPADGSEKPDDRADVGADSPDGDAIAAVLPEITADIVGLTLDTGPAPDVIGYSPNVYVIPGPVEFGSTDATT